MGAFSTRSSRERVQSPSLSLNFWGRGILLPGLGGGFKDLEGGLESEPRLDPGNEGCKSPGPGLGVVLAGKKMGQFVTQGHKLPARGMEHD